MRRRPIPQGKPDDYSSGKLGRDGNTGGCKFGTIARYELRRFDANFPVAIPPHIARVQHAIKHVERLAVLLNFRERCLGIQPARAVVNVDFVPGRSGGDPRDVAGSVVVDTGKKAPCGPGREGRRYQTNRSVPEISSSVRLRADGFEEKRRVVSPQDICECGDQPSVEN